MSELTPTGAVVSVERQVRRVRRRKNLYELQRALYWMVAATGLAAIVLLPLALFADAPTFALAAWSTLAAVVVLGVTLARGARRRWLSRAGTLAFIEGRGTLAGRVRTLLELGQRPAASASFFHPLLVSEVRATLGTWTPALLVPRRVPGRPLGAAIVTSTLLALLVAIAMRLSPTPAAVGLDERPGRIANDRPGPATQNPGGAGFAAAPNAARRPSDARKAEGAPTTSGGGSSSLTELSSALQEDVRERVWGKAWERVREALARAGTSGTELDTEDGATGEEVDAEGREDAAVANRERRSGAGRNAEEADEAEADEHEGRDASSSAQAAADDANDDSGGDGGTSGAGNATSPGDLFNGSAVDTAASDASFELSLAARMRSDDAGRRHAGGPPPDADPDTRPTLANDQRRETAAHRMTVPAAYEQVVREVFAHDEEP